MLLGLPLPAVLPALHLKALALWAGDLALSAWWQPEGQ